MSTESRNDVEKTLLHTRDVSSKGYIRTDGMFDIEGIITDKKSYDIPKSDGTILKEGEPLHQMVVKITIDININRQPIICIFIKDFIFIIRRSKSCVIP